MLLEIDYHSGVPIYRQIIAQIKEQVMANGLQEEEKLETVRELAAQLKVNPMTVSKAYSFLESEGIVERKRGIGLFVARVRKGQKEQIKTEMLDAAVNAAAVTAVQLGVPEEEAVEFFRRRYQEYNSGKRRRK